MKRLVFYVSSPCSGGPGWLLGPMLTSRAGGPVLHCWWCTSSYPSPAAKAGIGQKILDCSDSVERRLNLSGPFTYRVCIFFPSLCWESQNLTYDVTHTHRIMYASRYAFLVPSPDETSAVFAAVEVDLHGSLA